MKICRIAMMGLCAVMLTGCGAALPEMSDEDLHSVGEYAAITLLKYDANSKSRLVDLSGLQEENEQPAMPQIQDTPEEPKPQEPENSVPETPVIDRTENETGNGEGTDSMESFFALPESVKLVYSGREIADSYQEDANLYFALEAAAGKKLLILHFDMINQSGEDQAISIIDQRNSYRVTVSEGYTKAALTTMLENDLATFMGTILAGESRDLVLLVEVDQDRVDQIGTVTLNLKNEQKTYTIQLD